MGILKKIQGMLSLAALVSLGFAAQADHAAARASGAFIGYAVPISDAGCFGPWDGGAFQACAGTKTYELNLNFDVSGSKTVKVTVSQAGTVCTLTARHRNGVPNGSTVTFAVTQSVSGGFNEMVASAVVPSFGYTTVSCNMLQNSRLVSVNWN